MVITVDLDEATVTKIRELRELRDSIKTTHAGLTCKGCSTCEYEIDLTRRLEGGVLWRVMESVRATVPQVEA